MAITAYKVVKSPVVDAEALIGQMIALGWQPLGAPLMVEPDRGTIYQAMIQGSADGGGTGPTTIVVADITDATEVGQGLLLAADQAAARAAIGAGTSSLALGTTAGAALAGNYQPTAANISDAGAFGRQLLQAADQAAAKTLLGIAP